MHGCLARTALLALVLAAGFASTAAAASPMPGQTYEGPGPKGGYDVILVVSSSGKKVTRLTLGFERGCRRGGKRLRQPASPVFLRNVRIRKGRFAHRRALRYPSTGGSMTTTVRGRFTDGGRKFVGTVRETMQNPQTGIRCNSGAVRFSGAVPERVLVNGSWAGSTAQGKPVALTITPDGVTAMTVELVLTCRNGEQIVRAMGPFTEPARVSTELEFRAGSWTQGLAITAAGTARRGLVQGVLTASDAISRPDAEGDDRTYSCASGDVAFEARPSAG